MRSSDDLRAGVRIIGGLSSESDVVFKAAVTPVVASGAITAFVY
jgi:hypothetical protein